jgi:hypothetical protein
MERLGVFLAFLGVGLMIVAGYDFFTLDLWEEPKYFWMFFVGMPLLFVGFVLNGPRLQRIMLEKQKDTIRETMKVMGEGINAGLNKVDKYCPHCGEGSAVDDNFCSKCGKALNN